MPAPVAAGAMVMAGGTILSTLMQGLLQMKQAEEAQKYDEYKSAQARVDALKTAQMQAPIAASQAQSQSLANLMSVWGRR